MYRGEAGKEEVLHPMLGELHEVRSESKTLNETSSRDISYQGKVVDLDEIYNFAVKTYL